MRRIGIDRKRNKKAERGREEKNYWFSSVKYRRWNKKIIRFRSREKNSNDKRLEIINKNSRL